MLAAVLTGAVLCGAAPLPAAQVAPPTEEADPWSWESPNILTLYVDPEQGDDNAQFYGTLKDFPMRTITGALAAMNLPSHPVFGGWPYIRIVLQDGTAYYPCAQGPSAAYETFPITIPGSIEQLSIEAATPFGAALQEDAPSCGGALFRLLATDLRLKDLSIRLATDGSNPSGRSVVETYSNAYIVGGVDRPVQMVFDGVHFEISSPVVRGQWKQAGLWKIDFRDCAIEFVGSLLAEPRVVNLDLIKSVINGPPELEVAFQRTRVVGAAPLRVGRSGPAAGRRVRFAAYNSAFRGYVGDAVELGNASGANNPDELEVWHCAFRTTAQVDDLPVSVALTSGGTLGASAASSIYNTVFTGHAADLATPAQQGGGGGSLLTVRGVASDRATFAATQGFVDLSGAGPLWFDEAAGGPALESHLLPGSPLVDAGWTALPDPDHHLARSLYGEPRQTVIGLNAAADIGPDEHWARRAWVVHLPGPGDDLLLRHVAPFGEWTLLMLEKGTPGTPPASSFDPFGWSWFLPASSSTILAELPTAQLLPDGLSGLSELKLSFQPGAIPPGGSWVHMQGASISADWSAHFAVSDTNLYIRE